MPFRKATKADLALGSWVRFPSATSFRGWWIAPGTRATVTGLPAGGDVEVRPVSGDCAGVAVMIGADFLELCPTSVATAAANGWDGRVVEIAPGIGVEVLATEDPAYPVFVWQQIERILATAAGRAVIASFDPANQGSLPAGALPPGRPLAVAPYVGLSVLVGPPRPLYKAFGNKMVYPLIRTQDVGPRRSATARVTDGAKIPRIDFFERPAEGAPGVPIGAADGPLFTHAGVEGHADFPARQDFDVILFHEFVHAYLSNTGLTIRKNDPRVAPYITDTDQAEEELVVGLEAGRGLPVSENAYRVQTKRPLRTTYKAVRLNDQTVAPTAWDAPVDLPAAVGRWEQSKGLPHADVGWLVTGR